MTKTHRKMLGAVVRSKVRPIVANKALALDKGRLYALKLGAISSADLDYILRGIKREAEKAVADKFREVMDQLKALEGRIEGRFSKLEDRLDEMQPKIDLIPGIAAGVKGLERDVDDSLKIVRPKGPTP